ncbi:hypothetical protein NCCP2222_33100 [Sporosarcina sp. NCCP-2222]|nr:hypothetical protein NCCP2222_33100 [Sporosarcina sp. NCCP-2222]
MLGSEKLATYSAAKWAVNGLTKSVALEYAKQGIRVNSICPGLTLKPAVVAWAKEVPEQEKYVENDIPLGRMAGRKNRHRLHSGSVRTKHPISRE